MAKMTGSFCLYADQADWEKFSVGFLRLCFCLVVYVVSDLFSRISFC